MFFHAIHLALSVRCICMHVLTPCYVQIDLYPPPRLGVLLILSALDLGT